MNWLNKKKYILAVLLILCMSVMCACGDEIPDMTEEEMGMITDYSAALLLKYDSNTPSRLLPESVSESYAEYQAPNVVLAAPDASGTTDVETQASMSDTTVTDNTKPDQNDNITYSNGFADFITDTGISIEYSGMLDVVDSYPEDNDNLYFATDASAGNKLVVAHFVLSNVSQQTINVNMNNYNLRYRISINGGKNRNIMTTMLDNDILSYFGSVDAGESVDLVAIAEVPEEDVTNLESAVFTIKGEDFSGNIKLK